MNKYLLQGKLTAKDGQRQALAEILIKASKLAATAKGRQLYAVALDETDAILFTLQKSGIARKTTTTH